MDAASMDAACDGAVADASEEEEGEGKGGGWVTDITY